MYDKLVDPDGVHSEFTRGGHGRKVDFEKIPLRSSAFRQWVRIVAADVAYDFPEVNRGLTYVIGVASGANRLVAPVASALNETAYPIETEKVGGVPVLGRVACRRIKVNEPDTVLVLEDVGSTGFSSGMIAEAAVKSGASRVVVHNTVQRATSLLELDRRRIDYSASFHEQEELPVLTPQQCLLDGYCQLEWELTPKQR